ncbi:MAG: hypothetical protein LBP20_05780 [Treponema sp.]|nr:hypothetical protein [Treponema sp.]
MSTKKPHFFCDNCGAEVEMSAKNCPACGRFFASVRCPKCGFTGKDEDFIRGCPVCGYSTVPGGPAANGGGKHEANSKKSVSRSRGRTTPRKAAFTPPFWLYLFAALTLICALTILYNVLR